MKLWTWKEENLPSVWHAVRTAVAATLSVLLARLIRLPEEYWAVIATLVVMQSPLSSTVPLAIQRIVASALGALLGAIESACFGANLVAFALTIFVLGLISIGFRLEKVGYSYAGMTLAIIVLIQRPEAPWIAAVHRFTEVSLGILVALAVVAVWREEQQFLGDAKGE
jgi:Predicted membrane protein